MAQHKMDEALTGIHGVALDPEIIEQLSTVALEGSGEAARKIAMHYVVAQGNRKEGLFWALIAAENGDVIGQYYAGFLLKDDPDPMLQKRASFWLKKAADQGDTTAMELLSEIEAQNK